MIFKKKNQPDCEERDIEIVNPDEKKDINAPAEDKPEFDPEKFRRGIIEEVLAAVNNPEGTILKERLIFEAEKQLAGKNLPTEFARVLAGETAEETAENIAGFERLFSQKLADAVSEKMKGSVPKIGDTKSKDSFLEGLE